MQRVSEIVIKTAGEITGIEATYFNDSSSLFDDLGLDSIECVELIQIMNKLLGVKVENRSGKNSETVGELAQLFKDRLSQC